MPPVVLEIHKKAYRKRSAKFGTSSVSPPLVLSEQTGGTRAPRMKSLGSIESADSANPSESSPAPPSAAESLSPGLMGTSSGNSASSKTYMTPAGRLRDTSPSPSPHGSFHTPPEERHGNGATPLTASDPAVWSGIPVGSQPSCESSVSQSSVMSFPLSWANAGGAGAALADLEWDYDSNGAGAVPVYPTQLSFSPSASARSSSSGGEVKDKGEDKDKEQQQEEVSSAQRAVPEEKAQAGKADAAKSSSLPAQPTPGPFSTGPLFPEDEPTPARGAPPTPPAFKAAEPETPQGAGTTLPSSFASATKGGVTPADANAAAAESVRKLRAQLAARAKEIHALKQDYDKDVRHAAVTIESDRDALVTALKEFDPSSSAKDKRSAARIATGLLTQMIAMSDQAGGPEARKVLLSLLQQPLYDFLRRVEFHAVLDPRAVARVHVLYINELLRSELAVPKFRVLPMDDLLVRDDTSGPGSGVSSPPPLPPPGRYDNERTKVAVKKQSAGKRIRNSLRSMMGGQQGGPGYQWQASASLNGDAHEAAARAQAAAAAGSAPWQRIMATEGFPAERRAISDRRLAALHEEALRSGKGSWNVGVKLAHVPPARLRVELADWLGRAHGFLSAGKGGRAEAEAVAAVILDGWLAGAGAPRGQGCDVLGSLLRAYTEKAFALCTDRMWANAAALLSQQADTAEGIQKLTEKLQLAGMEWEEVRGAMVTDGRLGGDQTPQHRGGASAGLKGPAGSAGSARPGRGAAASSPGTRGVGDLRELAMARVASLQLLGEILAELRHPGVKSRHQISQLQRRGQALHPTDHATAARWLEKFGQKVGGGSARNSPAASPTPAAGGAPAAAQPGGDGGAVATARRLFNAKMDENSPPPLGGHGKNSSPGIGSPGGKSLLHGGGAGAVARNVANYSRTFGAAAAAVNQAAGAPEVGPNKTAAGGMVGGACGGGGRGGAGQWTNLPLTGAGGGTEALELSVRGRDLVVRNPSAPAEQCRLPQPSEVSSMNYGDLMGMIGELPAPLPTLMCARTAAGVVTRYSRMYSAAAAAMPQAAHLLQWQRPDGLAGAMHQPNASAMYLRGL